MMCHKGNLLRDTRLKGVEVRPPVDHHRMRIVY